MKVSKPDHKALLQHCFFDEGPQGPKQKTFTLDKMLDASGAFTKLLKSAGEGGKFSDEEVEFTPGEVAVLKQVFDEKAGKGFPVGSGETALEVKGLFEGKNAETK